jgi:hypothetical protein
MVTTGKMAIILKRIGTNTEKWSIEEMITVDKNIKQIKSNLTGSPHLNISKPSLKEKTRDIPETNKVDSSIKTSKAVNNINKVVKSNIAGN